MAFVYHIHLPEHLGFFEQGYIGFTSNTVESRWREHKSLAASNTRSYPIYNAIRKYGERLVVTTLVEGSSEYCLDLEYKLRPTPNIAWNISCGGGAPMLGKKHTPETLKKMKACNTPEKRKKQSDRMKLIPTWLHGSSDELVWASASDIYKCFNAHVKISPELLARAFNLGKKKLEAMHRKFLSGWIPELDSEWLKWSQNVPKKIQGGWKVGDALLEAEKPILTEELRKRRGLGGKNRIWTEEAKENLRKINLGRKHTADTIRKMSKLLRGVKRTQEQKAAISQRLVEQPWTNAKAIHSNWAKAQYMYEAINSGKTHAELLREFDLPRKSGTLAKIIKKIKSGWNPLTDEKYLSWLEEYKQKEAINAKT